MKWRNQYPDRLSPLLLLLTVWLGCVNYVKAQDLPAPSLSLTLDSLIKPADTLKTNLSFAVDSLLRIQDETNHLKPVFDCLRALESGKDTVLTIVHLGDSHVQAGHLSGRLMRLLHQQFGNAGRGWIAPFKLS